MNLAPMLVLGLILAIPMSTVYSQDLPQLGADPLEDVISEMTVEEKAKLLVGMGFRASFPGLPEIDPDDAGVPEKVAGAAGRTHAIPRLGIPSLTLSDGPAGVRIDPKREGVEETFHATAFPVATLMAATWDVHLVRDVGKAFGHETREYGVDILLAPGMNIHRNPLGGRNFEYYSEDPLLSGRMAAAFVNGVESEGVGTSIKHFAANNQEFNRLQSNSITSRRALREIYLKGFEIAVKEAQPWTVMSSYNRINGAYTSESRDLLTTILRDEWGFEGFVVSDWFGGTNPVAQMHAGNDMLMPGYLAQTQGIIAAVNGGVLDEKQLDENVARVLRVVLQSPAFKGYAYSNKPDLKGHAALARRAAGEGAVLLKNEGKALPLAENATIALFGNAGHELILGGTGSGDVNEAYSVPLEKGLTDAGFVLEPSTHEAYAAYIAEQKANRKPPPMPFFPVPPIPEMELHGDLIHAAAASSDVALVALGRDSGEFTDRKLDGDFNLNDVEQAAIESVASAFHEAGKKVVVVMNVAGVTETASWRDKVDAILVAWQPGQEGGSAMADVLSGQVNPSGKLPATFPTKYADVPSAANFPGKVLPEYADSVGNPFRGLPTEVIYDEGIYVGYRYYQTFEVEPAYPFGYGLSYTTFEFSDLELDVLGLSAEVTATVKVTNSGSRPGREVVQLYVGAPGETMHKPKTELRGFAKTALLKPGQAETVTFKLDGSDLASFDTDRSAWVVEAGRYVLNVGSSSAEIRQKALFQIPGEIIVEEVHDVLIPEVEITERSAPKSRQ